MWRAAIRYIVQREEFTIESALSPDEYLRRLSAAIAAPLDILAPKTEQPLRGEIRGNEFTGQIRFPYTFDYGANVHAQVAPAQAGCAIHIIVSGAWWVSVMFLAGSILMLTIAIQNVIDEGWTRDNAISVIVLTAFIVFPFFVGRNILVVRRAAEDIFGRISVREPYAAEAVSEKARPK